MKINFGDLSIASPTFKHGERMPDRYGAQDSPSPPLTWSNGPDGTCSFAIVCHDPDAPLVDGFCHWVIYGIAADCTELPEGGVGPHQLGVNGLGEPVYMPPGPPPGHGEHFYYFHIYAIGEVELPDGLGRGELLAAIDEHIIEQARIVGIWSN